MKIALQIVAGLAMYAFLRALRLDGRVVLVGAVLYALNGTYAWASDGPSQPLAFLPLVLLGIEQARTHKGVGGWGWLAVGLGYLLLAGFPETAFLVGTLGLCWAVLRLVQQPASERLSFALRILAGGVPHCCWRLRSLSPLRIFCGRHGLARMRALWMAGCRKQAGLWHCSLM